MKLTALVKENASVLTALSAVAVPVVIAITGFAVNETISQRETSAQYLQFAISILASDSESSEERALREYGVQLLSHASPVNLSDELIGDLVDGSITVPAFSPELLRPLDTSFPWDGNSLLQRLLDQDAEQRAEIEAAAGTAITQLPECEIVLPEGRAILGGFGTVPAGTHAVLETRVLPSGSEVALVALTEEPVWVTVEPSTELAGCLSR